MTTNGAYPVEPQHPGEYAGYQRLPMSDQPKQVVISELLWLRIGRLSTEKTGNLRVVAGHIVEQDRGACQRDLSRLRGSRRQRRLLEAALHRTELVEERRQSGTVLRPDLQPFHH